MPESPIIEFSILRDVELIKNANPDFILDPLLIISDVSLLKTIASSMNLLEKDSTFLFPAPIPQMMADIAILSTIGDRNSRFQTSHNFLDSFRSAIFDGYSSIDAAFLKFNSLSLESGDSNILNDLPETIIAVSNDNGLVISNIIEFVSRESFITSYLKLVATLAAIVITASDHSIDRSRQRAALIRLVTLGILLLKLAKGQRFPAKWKLRDYFSKTSIKLPLEWVEHQKIDRGVLVRWGIMDHYVVEQKWEAYELDEIADVQNIMAGEKRIRVHERRTEAESIREDSKETYTSDEKENQTNTLYDFTEAAKDAQKTSFNAQADLSIRNETGPVLVSANAGASFSHSAETSRDVARRYATEVLDRAKSIFRTRVNGMRRTRDLLQIIERNRHEFDNVGQESKHKIGLYRWITQKDKAILLRYRDRLAVEVLLGQCGAWLRYALDQRDGVYRRSLPQYPAWPAGLSDSGQIQFATGNPGDYRALAKHFGATGINPPPEQRVLGASIVRVPDEGDVWENQPYRAPNGVLHEEIRQPKKRANYTTTQTVSVPRGWRAVSWTATVSSVRNHELDGEDINIAIVVGDDRRAVQRLGLLLSPAFVGTKLRNGNVGNIDTGEVPIVIVDRFAYGCAVTVLVTCEPTDEAIAIWRQATFDTFLTAHQRRIVDYNNQLTELNYSESTTQEHSPQKIQDMITTELKRQVIELLLPDNWLGSYQVQYLPASQEPVADMELLQKVAPIMQFMEQAFDWALMVHVLYPHFWVARGTWPSSVTDESKNLQLDRFLSCGGARVVVPAKRGFEAEVRLFLDYGIIWGGSRPPIPGEPDYLSVAEELFQLQKSRPDAERVGSWPVYLPTTLVALDADPQFPIRRGQS